MFNRIRRYYNQNRKQIWRVIIIIAFAFAILQLANLFAKQQNEYKIENIMLKQNTSNQNNTQSNEGNSLNSSNEINISQNTNNNTNDNTSTNIEEKTIKEFTSYCNQKELEKAYNMISNECKEQIFDSLERFTEIYYNGAFENKIKDIEIDNWAGHTYLVYFRESAIALGKSTQEGQKGDYITVVRDDDGNYKLNINSFIGYKKIEKAKENEGVKIEIKGKNVYMNYEEYNIIAINNTDDYITLDTLYNPDSLYILDNSGTNFSSYTHELSSELLTIEKSHGRELNIKFYNSYNSNRKIKSMVFSDLRISGKKTKFTIDF